MNAYGCNTFSFYNDKKDRFWVKFHILSNLGARGLSDAEAKLIAGEDPNFLARDLHDAIDNKKFPTWKFACQIMPEKAGYENPFTFDCTKIWKHEDYPLIDLGSITLDRCPTDYHTEVEQAAFSPATVIPGVSCSPDRLLQGRLFLYDDTQFHRLGAHYKQIPVNLPRCPISTNYVGGAHQMETKSKYPHYFPSTFGGPKPAPEFEEPPLMKTWSGAAGYYDYEYEGTDADYYQQVRDFVSVMSKPDCKAMIHNIAISLSKISNGLAEKVVTHLRRISPTLGESVSDERCKILDGEATYTEGQKLHDYLRKMLDNDGLDQREPEIEQQ